MIGLVGVQTNYENCIAAGAHAKLYSDGKVERMVFRCGVCTRLLEGSDSVYMMMDAAYCSQRCRDEVEIETEPVPGLVSPPQARAPQRTYSWRSLDPRMLESFSGLSELSTESEASDRHYSTDTGRDGPTDAESQNTMQLSPAEHSCNVGAWTTVLEMLAYVTGASGAVACLFVQSFRLASGAHSTSKVQEHRLKRPFCARRHRNARRLFPVSRFHSISRWTTCICSTGQTSANKDDCLPWESKVHVSSVGRPKRSVSFSSVRDEHPSQLVPSEKKSYPRCMSEGSTVASVTFSRQVSDE